MDILPTVIIKVALGTCLFCTTTCVLLALGFCMASADLLREALLIWGRCLLEMMVETGGVLMMLAFGCVRSVWMLVFKCLELFLTFALGHFRRVLMWYCRQYSAIYRTTVLRLVTTPAAYFDEAVREAHYAEMPFRFLWSLPVWVADIWFTWFYVALTCVCLLFPISPLFLVTPALLQYVTTCRYHLVFLYLHWAQLSDFYRFYMADVLQQSGEKIDFRAFRAAFQNQTLLTKSLPAGNPHAYAAADRSGADDTINNLALTTGNSTWSLSASPKDQWNELDGERAVRGVRDMLIRPQNTPITSYHILKLVDVDSYLTEAEFGNWLSYGRPMVLYSWLIRSCFASGKDGFYHPVRDRFRFRSSGGGYYEHQLWDWDVDNFTVYSSRIRRYIYVYVHVRKLDFGRALVCLMPAMTFDPIFFVAVPRTYDTTRRMARLVAREVESTPSSIYIMSTGSGANGVVSFYDPSLSTGKTLSLAHYSNAASAVRLSPSFTASSLQRITGSEEPDYHLTAMIKLTAKLDNALQPRPEPVERPRMYTYAYNDVSDEPRNTGRVFMRPIVDGAFAPTSCKSNDLACIQHRVVGVAPSQKRPPRRFTEYRNEFVRLLVGSARGSLVPFTLEEVLDNATEKQRRKYQEALSSVRRDKMQAFQKTEAYPEIKDPRNIINQDPHHVLHWSCFIQAVVDCMKNELQTSWYAFGLQPEALADRVHQLAAGCCHELLETDFSRFDGTIAYFLRELELLILLSFFPHRYHQQIATLWAATLDQVGKTRFSIKFFLRSQRRSGSGETSWGNSTINAYVAYCSHREVGQTPKEAWSALGLYGGDDGISDLPRGMMEKVCNFLELKVKPAYKAHGEPLSFLGRVWPEPAVHNGSYMDPLRVLHKIHYVSCADPTIPPELHAWRKGVSLLATDAQTPILGDLALTLMALGSNSRRTISWDYRPHKAFLNELTGATRTYDQIIDRFKDSPVYPPIRKQAHNYLVFEKPIVDLVGGLKVYTAWVEKFDQWVRFPNFKPPLLHKVPLPETKSTVDCEQLQLGAKLGKAPTIPKAERQICPLMATRKCPPKCPNWHPHDACRDYFAGKCHRSSCRFKHY